MSSNKPKRRSQDDMLSQSQLLPSRPQTQSSTQPQSPKPPPAPPQTTTSQQSSPSPSPQSPSPSDEPAQDLPLSMSISLLLPSLPIDARTALSQLTQTLDPPTLKVAVRFHAIGSAPQLKQKVFKISASSKFGAVVGFLRRRLYGKGGEGEGAAGKGGGPGGGQGLFCYVNSVFAPGLDEGVGNLWRCFKTDDQLIVGYSITPAFG